MAEARVILVRHGETEWNRELRIQGYRADSPLTGAGRAQAQAAAERLAREGIDALYSSDAGRARQTAAPVAAATGLAIAEDPDLRERNYGVFEGRTFSEVERAFPEEYRRFRARDPHYAAPEGESAVQFRDRVVAALERIAGCAIGKRVAVVTHGGVLGVLYRHATGMALDTPRDYSIANASLNRLCFSAGRWRIEAWGDVAHLEIESRDAPRSLA
jgi:probable phosphoglycerate mutase